VPLVGLTAWAWFSGVFLAIEYRPGLVWVAAGWPLAFWCPAVMAMFPAVFQPWCATARLNRRIRAAKLEQELIALRQRAEAEEARAANAVTAYIDGERDFGEQP
jgi:hypothetical protein